MSCSRQALIFLVLTALASSATAGAAALSIHAQPSKPVQGEPVTFSLRDAHPNATAWVWEFGDGGSDNGTPTPSHTYASPGPRIVRVTVSAPNETNQSATLALEVALQPPSLVPTWLYWVMPGLVGLGLIAIGLMVLLRGQPVIYNRVFFFLYTASGIKGLIEAVFFFIAYQQGGSIAQLLPWDAASRAVGFLYPHLFLWFVLVFPRPLRPWLKNGWRGAIVLLLSTPFFLLQFGMNFDTAGLFNGYVSLLAVASLGLLVYHAWETDGKEERHRIRLLAGAFFLLVMATVVATVLQFGGEQELAIAAGVIGSPILEIFGCVLLMYAILRYQLMGVELFLKRVTRATGFAVLIGSVFVVVSNSVEQLFQVKFLAGVPLDFLVAGFISTILMYPIQKLTERVANRMFPQATNLSPDHLSLRRMEIYEAQLRYALLDGSLKQKELTMLHALRDSLGLRADELQRVAQRFPTVSQAVLWPAIGLRST